MNRHSLFPPRGLPSSRVTRLRSGEIRNSGGFFLVGLACGPP